MAATPFSAQASTSSAPTASAHSSLAVTVHMVREPGTMATSATDAYETGWLEACAIINSNASCNTNSWWVKMDFGVTWDNKGHAWRNVSSCSANHTTYSWCSYVNNGTNDLSLGFNYGGSSANSDYARIDFSGYNGPNGLINVREVTGNLPVDTLACMGTQDAFCSGGQLFGATNP